MPDLSRGGPVAPVHLLLGPENGQKQDHIDEIRNRLTANLDEPPEEHRHYAYETDITELIGLLNNQSLFSPHRLVIVSEIQEISKKAPAEALASYIARPSAASTLILTSDEYRIDRRIQSAVGKKQTRMFWELFENQKRGWIQNHFRTAGYTVTAEAIELILELVENDTADLKRECDKLTLFYSAGTTIGADEVERILFHSKNENVFSLFADIADADFAAALETMHAIMLSGRFESAGLFGGLIWQIKRLLEFRRLKDANYSDDDAAKRLGIRGKRNLRTYQNGAQRYSTRDLEAIYLRTYECDLFFRETRTDAERTLMDLYLYDIIVARGVRPILSHEGVT